ncbi:phosphoadenylyl-sulfate reductase [Buchnera aphidicola]|uniref:phosphoadenylyl-sulfate reductase n=1 Tax=Buchnera aphidicola TaxID=9 RepID=UPI003464C77D
MSTLNLFEINTLNKEEQYNFFSQINIFLKNISAEKRIAWAIENLCSEFVLSSSFGIQSAVCLHLIIQQKPDIPVILIDTGYLFPETYIFIDQLTDKLKLNLHVFRSKISAAWQEARYGKLWEKGITGIEFYNTVNKVEPMNEALQSLSAKTWFAGLRRQQSSSRYHLSFISMQKKIFKFLPILDWDTHKVFKYLKKNNLSYHPLWDKGYLSIGDVHTTSKPSCGMKEEDTRFFGLKRECGLHVE